MDVQAHWESIYTSKAPDRVSWYRPHLEASLALVQRISANPSVSLIDVGGGASTLVDDLLAGGYRNLTVLDVAASAIETSRLRLGPLAEHVRWIVADVLRVSLPSAAYDIWHDRAVFHFLTDAADRAAYVRQVAQAVRSGGHVIVSTFGPEGPMKCSGLDAVRYDAPSLQREFGSGFRLLEGFTELHQTPFGTVQQFLCCHFAVE